MSIESVMPPISSSVVPFSSCLQSFPASGSFPMSQFSSGGQVLEFQLQPQSFQWIFRTDFLQHWLVGSPCSPRDSQESSLTPQFKSINSLALPPFFIVQLSHPYMTTRKPHSYKSTIDQAVSFSNFSFWVIKPWFSQIRETEHNTWKKTLDIY